MTTTFGALIRTHGTLLMLLNFVDEHLKPLFLSISHVDEHIQPYLMSDEYTKPIISVPGL